VDIVVAAAREGNQRGEEGRNQRNIGYTQYSTTNLRVDFQLTVPIGFNLLPTSSCPHILVARGPFEFEISLVVTHMDIGSWIKDP
jgi:hypothetical protein